VAGIRDGAWTIAWRVFAEQQDAVPVASRWSLFGGGSDTRFISNTTARAGVFSGASVRLRRTWGGDPGGWRVFTDVRGEAAGGAAGYGRLAAEAAVTRDVGLVSLSAGAGAGSSAGDLPPQRRWFLGGARTVRGQEAGALAGSAFRLAHAEAAVPVAFLKASVFADAGWAGDRTDLWRAGRPLSGAGVGLSALNGLVRVDIATGLAPRRPGPRVDITLDARF
jgi:hemolysin activation/secretion protein